MPVDPIYTPKVSDLKQYQWNQFVRTKLQPTLQADKVTDEMLDSDTPFTVNGVTYKTGKEYTDKLLKDFITEKGLSGPNDLQFEDVKNIQETFNNIITGSQSYEPGGYDFAKEHLKQSIETY